MSLLKPRPPTSISTLSRETLPIRLCLYYFTTTTWKIKVIQSHHPLLFSHKNFLNTDCISRKTVSGCSETTSPIYGWHRCPFLSRPYFQLSRAGSRTARTIYIRARIQLSKSCLMFTPTTSVSVNRYVWFGTQACGINATGNWIMGFREKHGWNKVSARCNNHRHVVCWLCWYIRRILNVIESVHRRTDQGDINLPLWKAEPLRALKWKEFEPILEYGRSYLTSTMWEDDIFCQGKTYVFLILTITNMFNNWIRF